MEVVDALRKLLPGGVVVGQQALFAPTLNLGQGALHVFLQELLRLEVKLVSQGLGVGNAQGVDIWKTKSSNNWRR